MNAANGSCQQRSHGARVFTHESRGFSVDMMSQR